MIDEWSSIQVYPTDARLRIRPGLWSLLPIWLLSTTGALQASNTEISVGMSTGAEYDDNVNRANTADKKSSSDLVLRVSPTIGVRLPWEDHSVSFDLSGDYRNGISTGISDLNFSATAGMDLVFTGGFRFSISDTYTRSSFDQELREEAGTPDSDTNRFQVAGSYTFVERLRAEVSYSQQTQDFDFDGQTSAVDRDIGSLEGAFFLPVTRSAVAHFSYSLEDQDSPDRPDRAYSDEGYRVGISWEGPERFGLRFELGQQNLDFDLAGVRDFDGKVGEISTEIQFTEFTAADLAVGRDGFGELTYEGGLSYRNDRDFEARLTFGRQTEPSFSFEFSTSVLQSTHIDLTLRDQLADRFAVSLTAGYQLQESAFSEEERNDRVLNVTLRVDYPMREWLKLGARYQFARRASGQQSLAFSNNRIGLFATFSFQGGG